jgi:hypothetical protein
MNLKKKKHMTQFFLSKNIIYSSHVTNFKILNPCGTIKLSKYINIL